MDIEYKYTADEVAEMLNVTGETIRRWCRERRLRFVKFPGKKGEYRFAEKDVKEFLAELNMEPIRKFILDVKEKSSEGKKK